MTTLRGLVWTCLHPPCRKEGTYWNFGWEVPGDRYHLGTYVELSRDSCRFETLHRLGLNPVTGKEGLRNRNANVVSQAVPAAETVKSQDAGEFEAETRGTLLDIARAQSVSCPAG